MIAPVEIRHLRSFLALAEEQHFGRAAERLHIAQPALSQQLKALERQLGQRLVDRSTRRVELTPAGHLLAERARAILADVARTTTDLDLLAQGKAGRVRIGFVGTATYDVLPRIAQRIRAELPDLDLELHGELLGPDLLDRVHTGDLDLAVLRPGPLTPSDLVVEHLRDEPLLAVLAATHPRAGQRQVQLVDLAGQPLITHPAGQRSTMQPLVLDACRTAGFEPEVIEVGETSTLVTFVAAGLGFGLVPASVRALRLDGVAYLALARSGARTPTAPLALAHRPEPSAATQRVAALLRQALS